MQAEPVAGWSETLDFVYSVLPPATARHSQRVGLKARVFGDFDTARAALLHDVLEDGVDAGKPVTAYDLKSRWGVAVATIVLDVTDVFTPEACPQISRRYRKALEAVRLALTSDEARFVKYLDIEDNQGRTEGREEVFLQRWREEKTLYAKVRVRIQGDDQTVVGVEQALSALMREDEENRDLWATAWDRYTNAGGKSAMAKRQALRTTLRA